MNHIATVGKSDDTTDRLMRGRLNDLKESLKRNDKKAKRMKLTLRGILRNWQLGTGLQKVAKKSVLKRRDVNDS